MFSKLSRWGCLAVVAAACAASQGCAGGRATTAAEGKADAPAETARAAGEPAREKEPEARGVMEEPPPPPEPIVDERDTLPDPSKLAPPTPAEVAAAVERIFKGAVAVESARGDYFLAGDFNGDRSQDLAVVVRPAPGRVAEINDELAAWILAAPLAASPDEAARLGVRAAAARQTRPQAEETDVLLAVVHGFRARGWRDPQATQTYVLKGAAGERLRPRPKKQTLRPDNVDDLPRIYGDVIAETIGGRGGFIYYDGARYSWYDPRTYRPPAPARLVHGRAERSPQ